MGFFIRKTLGALIMPLPMALLLGVVGWILWTRGQRRRLGQALVATCILGLAALSTEPVSRGLAVAVQGDAPAFPGDSVAFVVVLGSGHDSDPALPPTARLEAQALYRITEGVRIAQEQPWARLVLSGYGGDDPKPGAQVYAELAAALGMPPERMILEARPTTTAHEAELLAPLLGEARFALVTSATHMPRAVALFRARGLEPVPAPTGHLTRRSATPGLQRLIPGASDLQRSTAAWYEVVGRLWAKVAGDI